MITIQQGLAKAYQQLALVNNSFKIEAEILLAYVLEKNTSYLYAFSEVLLTKSQLIAFDKLIRQRSTGMPIAYILGYKEFWSLPLKVSKDTLIPRPETELLVELSLKLLPISKPITLLDLGTGSGAIACALAHERPHWTIYASDCCWQSLIIAQENATQHQLNNINFIHSYWFDSIPLSLKFDAIISNPPYIPSNDPHLLTDIRFEPITALSSGNSGLEALETIIHGSFNRLNARGLLMLEHGFNQKKSVTLLLEANHYESVQSWQDWQGNDRVAAGYRK